MFTVIQTSTITIKQQNHHPLIMRYFAITLFAISTTVSAIPAAIKEVSLLLELIRYYTRTTNLI